MSRRGLWGSTPMKTKALFRGDGTNSWLPYGGAAPPRDTPPLYTSRRSYHGDLGCHGAWPMALATSLAPRSTPRYVLLPAPHQPGPGGRLQRWLLTPREG